MAAHAASPAAAEAAAAQYRRRLREHRATWAHGLAAYEAARVRAKAALHALGRAGHGQQSGHDAAADRRAVPGTVPVGGRGLDLDAAEEDIATLLEWGVPEPTYGALAAPGTEAARRPPVYWINAYTERQHQEGGSFSD